MSTRTSRNKRIKNTCVSVPNLCHASWNSALFAQTLNLHLTRYTLHFAQYTLEDKPWTLTTIPDSRTTINVNTTPKHQRVNATPERVQSNMNAHSYNINTNMRKRHASIMHSSPLFLNPKPFRKKASTFNMESKGMHPKTSSLKKDDWPRFQCHKTLSPIHEANS